MANRPRSPVRVPTFLLGLAVLAVSASALAADTVLDMEVGFEHECTLNTCGKIECWGGYNQFFGEDADKVGAFVDLAVGRDHTCSLDDAGKVECWGRAFKAGEPEGWSLLGVPAGTYQQIDGGDFITCGLKTNNRVDCWGWNLGNTTTTEPTNYYAQVSAGWDFACGVTSGHNSVFCWGNKPAGITELRIANVRKQSDEKWVKVSAGSAHVCALSEAPNLAGGKVGRVYCWGDNKAEQVSPQHPTVPALAGEPIVIEIPNGSATVYRAPDTAYLDVSAGGTGTCTVRFNSSLAANDIECWGYPFTPYNAGLTVWGNPSHLPPLNGFVPDRVFLGFNDLCAIDDASGSVECWSLAYTDPLGDVDPDIGTCQP